MFIFLIDCLLLYCCIAIIWISDILMYTKLETTTQHIRNNISIDKCVQFIDSGFTTSFTSVLFLRFLISCLFYIVVLCLFGYMQFKFLPKNQQHHNIKYQKLYQPMFVLVCYWYSIFKTYYAFIKLFIIYHSSSVTIFMYAFCYTSYSVLSIISY